MLALRFERPFAGRHRGEDTDVVVVLIRAAVIIAAFAVPLDAAWALSTPLFIFLHVMLGVAIIFTFVQGFLFFRSYSLHVCRPIALVVDLLLVTAITATFADSGRNLFEIYYLVVITAAIWYRRSGAIITALVAFGLSIAAEYMATSYDPAKLAAQLAVTRLPLLLLVAIITAYLVRARDSERALNIEINHELRLARRLQSAMLPDQVPPVPGFDIAVRFQPARYVGGDLYAIQVLDDSRLLVVLADMAGKSVYGLVHLSALNSHLVAATHERLTPTEMAERINRAIYPALQPDSYAALFIASIETATGKIEFVNCGHLPPLLIHDGDIGNAVELSTEGILVGAVEEPAYQMKSEVLRPGDVAIFYTDGISEVRNRTNEQLGTARVLQAVERAVERDAEAICESVMSAYRDFSAARNTDDATLIVIRRPGPGRSSAPVSSESA